MFLYDLKVDKQMEPIGIDNRNPCFSWKICGVSYQKSFRIIVSTTENGLSCNPDMWDSGEVLSEKCFNIKYNGKPLKTFGKYYWKVIVNNSIESQSFFECSFLDAENEFKADWIGMPLAFGGSVNDVRIDLDVDKPVKKCRFYLANTGMARVFLNGALLDDCFFDGSLSVFDKVVPYRIYKLNLTLGRNSVCTQLGFGFYGAKMMYGLIRTEFIDGTVSVTPTFAGRIWNIKKSTVVSHSVYDGETYDARREEDWLSPDYKVTFGNWVAAFAVNGPKGNFKFNKIPPMRVVKTFVPEKVVRTDRGWFIDAGKNIAGFANITFKGKKDKRIVLSYAECLDESGHISKNNLRAAEAEDTYICSDSSIISYRPSFTYHGFKYIEILCDKDIHLKNIEICCIRSDIQTNGTFCCSDKTLNALHNMAVLTESNNLNGVFTDCPQRDERLGWLNDLTSRIYESVYNFHLENYLSNFIDLISLSMNEDGSIPDTVPFFVGCDKADPVAAYTILGIILYEEYGDKETLERNWTYFNKWIEFLISLANNTDGVLSYSLYGDWCPAKIYADDTYSKCVDREFVSGIYLLWYLEQMEKIAEILDKKDSLDKFAKLKELYKLNFDKKYYDKNNGIYGNGSQTECAMATTVFHWDKNLCIRLMDNAATDVKDKGYHMTCGNQGYRHLIYNLAEYGHCDVVLKLLENEEYPGWGYMLKCGATTVWERWEKDVGTDMHSFNHPMFCGYDGFLYKYIAGIKQEEKSTGYKDILIEPCFKNDINFVKSSIDTLYGKISVEWEKLGNEIKLKVCTPSNTNLHILVKGYIIEYDKKEYKNELALSNGKYDLVIKR